MSFIILKLLNTKMHVKKHVYKLILRLVIIQGAHKIRAKSHTLMSKPHKNTTIRSPLALKFYTHLYESLKLL